MHSEDVFSPEMKLLAQDKKIVQWLGLGLLFMWGCALALVADMTDSRSAVIKVIGYIAMLAISATGIGLSIYMSRFENAAKALDKRLHEKDEAARIWRQRSEAWQHDYEILQRESFELMKQKADVEKVALFWQNQAFPSIDNSPTLDLFDHPV